jgi:hypothetical protein
VDKGRSFSAAEVDIPAGCRDRRDRSVVPRNVALAHNGQIRQIIARVILRLPTRLLELDIAVQERRKCVFDHSRIPRVREQMAAETEHS